MECESLPLLQDHLSNVLPFNTAFHFCSAPVVGAVLIISLSLMVPS